MPKQQFDPIEAARAVAQYLPADPALWVERAALAGIRLATDGKGLFQDWSAPVADKAQADFLGAWLNLTPGGVGAVVNYLWGQSHN